MLWQNEDTQADFQAPDDIIDLMFAVDCKRLPVDHAYALSTALAKTAPWIADPEAGVGIHTIHVAGSQNGWERPRHGTGSFLMLSRRTKLTIRVPRERMHALCGDLVGKTIDIAGCPLTLGPGKVRPLSTETTLFARYVVGAPSDTEEDFLNRVVAELAERDIRLRNALCGKATPLATPDGTISTRSLMIARLSPQESVDLQRKGLGLHRIMGCGIFIPHKGVDPVGRTS